MSADLRDLARRLSGAYGPPAAEWVANLPELVDRMALLWALDLGNPFIPISYSYIVSARLPGGEPAILKLRYPGPDTQREIEALHTYAGRSVVRLLRSDLERGALLMEPASPGHDAARLGDQDAARALVEIMKSLHSATTRSKYFPTTENWGKGFGRYLRAYPDRRGPLPADLVQASAKLYSQLEDTAAAPVLLHGDLHHENMLFDQNRGWLAVDPQGVIGEPAYEMGAFLRNPIDQLAEQPDLAARSRQRVELLSTLTGIDNQRIIGWGAAQAVLSAIWAWEDQERDLSKWVTVAQALEVARVGG